MNDRPTLDHTQSFVLDTKPIFIAPPDGKTLEVSNSGPSPVVYAEGASYKIESIEGSVDAKDTKTFERPAWIVSDAIGANVSVAEVTILDDEDEDV